MKHQIIFFNFKIILLSFFITINSISFAGEVLVWNIENDSNNTLIDLPFYINGIAVNSDKSLLAIVNDSTDSNDELNLFNIENTENIKKIKTHSIGKFLNSGNSLGFYEYNLYIPIINNELTHENDSSLDIKVFNYQGSDLFTSNTITNNKQIEAYRILSIDYSKNNIYYFLYTERSDKVINYFDNGIIFELNDSFESIITSKLKYDHIILNHNDDEIILINILTSNKNTFQIEGNWTASIDINENCNRICLGSVGKIEIWDLIDNKWTKSHTLQLENQQKYAIVHLSADGKHVYYYLDWAG